MKEDDGLYSYQEYLMIVNNYKKLFKDAPNFFNGLQGTEDNFESLAKGKKYHNLLVGNPFSKIASVNEYEEFNDQLNNIMTLEQGTETKEKYELIVRNKLQQTYTKYGKHIGLSFGMNPWTDYYLWLWGKEYQGPIKHPCELLVVGGDWYPLMKMNEHARNKHLLDKSYKKFFNVLFDTEDYSEIEKQISRKRIAFANAFPHLRKGEKVTGGFTKNFYDISTLHLKDVIQIMQPKMIVSWGGNALWTMNLLNKVANKPVTSFCTQSHYLDIPWFPLYHPSSSKWSGCTLSIENIREIFISKK